MLTPTLTVVDTDPRPSRKQGSVSLSGDASSFSDLKTPLRTLRNQSVSGSSIDSGVGLSRTSSLSSLPHSKRSSRESPNTVDSISSPLLESQKPLFNNQSEIENTDCEEHSNGAKTSRRILDGEEDTVSSVTDGDNLTQQLGRTSDEDGLSQRPSRVSISSEALANLVIAAQAIVDDVRELPQPGGTRSGQPMHHLSVSSEQPLAERDGPCHVSVRRHSSADPYIPLTQRPNWGVERKRSAQPYFHRSATNTVGEADSSSCRGRIRKQSACIVCERKHREPTMSEPSVIIRTAMTPEHQKKRRYSEVLKVPHTSLKARYVTEVLHVSSIRGN